MPLAYRLFFRMPLMHAEKLSLQNEGVREFSRLVDEAPPSLKKTLQNYLFYARLHRDVVKRFGRFPGRNEALGRKSTRREMGYLRRGGEF